MAYSFKLQSSRHNFRVSGNRITCDMQAAKIVYIGGPYYDGEYTVTPTVDEQVLETKEKMMRDDVRVEAVPYTELANPAGYTAFIAAI